MVKIIIKNNKFLKRIIEIIIAVSIIFLTSPVTLIICILIKLNSRGPIFYKQERIGKNLKKFYCLKFRTMSEEAEDILDNLLSNNEEIKEEFRKTQKIKNDPRITYIGRFLRRLSLDELPQFFNIVKGEMSLIGPRPIIESEMERYGESLNEVFSINPGITGLWQVSGRNNLTYKRRVALDLLYVRNKNFKMNLNIIIRTIGVVIFPFDSRGY